MLAWNADTTNLPARYHHDLLDMVGSRHPAIGVARGSYMLEA